MSLFLLRGTLITSLVMITYLASIPMDFPVAQQVNDKVGHLLAFAYLAFLLDYSFPSKRFFPYKLLFLALYGLSIEIMQSYIPFRMFSWLDWFADVAGVVVYLLLLPLLQRFTIFQLQARE